MLQVILYQGRHDRNHKLLQIVSAYSICRCCRNALL